METKLYDLTNPQKAIWLTEQFYKGSTINNICGTVLVDEVVDFEKLEEAMNIFLRDNDSFRIRILLNKDGDAKQFFDDYEKRSFLVTDVSNDKDLTILEHNMASKLFDVLNDSLYNIRFFKFPNGNGGFIACISHLVGDACTASLLANKVMNIYSSLKKGECSPELPTSYVTYINSEKEYLDSPKFQKDKEYWESHFDMVPDIGTIPHLKSSSTISCSATREEFSINKEIVDNINTFCKNNKFTIFNFLMGIYAIYIGKISNLTDFTIGSPILNRANFIEKNTPGMFISTVPLKFAINGNMSFIEFAQQIGIDSLSMLRHQKFPYQNILEHIRTKNPEQLNLYDILISYQNSRTNRNNIDVPYSVRWTFNNNVADSLQIHIFDMNDEGNLNVAYDYRLNKYSKEDISDLHRRICHIIEQILANNNIYIKDIEIVTSAEKDKILNTFNNTFLEYDKTKTVVDYFEKQVEKNPDNIALVFENKSMTYKELNEKANSLARLLNTKKIGKNSIVGILVNRSFEMIISILAVLKSGAAYIPIDPEYPDERINYILKNSNASTIITLQKLVPKISSLEFSGLLIVADLSNKDIYSINNDNLNNIIDQDSLSYLIFTSGSTGNPKGVMLTHKNLNNFINSMFNKVAYLNDNIYHSIISITTISFDIFAFETIVSLCSGLKLFITNDLEQKITSKIERLIIDNNIEIIQSTPSIMNFHIDNSILNGFSKLKYVILAGEQLPKKLVDKILYKNPNCTIYNGYGPSETTIFSTITDVTHLDEITIGAPINNTQIYILNNDLSIMPINSMGEIYISGDGVGKGYINRDDLTLASYINNPFISNSTMYKTGDIGFWNSDGTISCRGRSDNQVKLRGLRIELGEIEKCINSYDPSITSCTIIKDLNNSQCLVAYFVSNPSLDTSGLREFVANILPNYMIPNYFIKLDKLPLTPNGKINKKLLATYNIDLSTSFSSHSKPRNDTEKLIVNSIMKKLGISDFGIDDNIFDYGADSLSIINILTDLFQHKISLKVYDFYKFPTVRELYDKVISEQSKSHDKNEEDFQKLDLIVENFNKTTDCSEVKDKKSILLTGSTGFFGAHILAQLLSTPDKINKIYCLIRQKNGLDISERLLNKLHFYFGNSYDLLFKKYVVCINSDIVSDSLGLSETDLQLLKENVDLVIHSAANVKHYGDYELFEKVNIKGTKQIIDLCDFLKIPLHYISTMTVSGNYLLEQNLNNVIFDENSFFVNQDFSDNVYSKSKLLAESLVIDAISRGLDATIYRIGDLAGRYSDGHFQSNISENAIYTRLKSILDISTIPDSILNNKLEFTPVDCASLAICKIIWSSNNKNRIFNIYNPNMISVNLMLHYMKQLNYIVKILPHEKFVELVQDIATDSNNQFKITGIISDFTKNNDLIYNYIIPTDNSITCNYLKNLGFKWPELDIEYFRKLLKYMKDVKFIN